MSDIDELLKSAEPLKGTGGLVDKLCDAIRQLKADNKALTDKVIEGLPIIQKLVDDSAELINHNAKLEADLAASRAANETLQAIITGKQAGIDHAGAISRAEFGRGYRLGIEAAAKWHVEKGKSFLNAMNCGSENGDAAHFERLNQRHIAYAKDIRNLPTGE